LNFHCKGPYLEGCSRDDDLSEANKALKSGPYPGRTPDLKRRFFVTWQNTHRNRNDPCQSLHRKSGEQVKNYASSAQPPNFCLLVSIGHVGSFLIWQPWPLATMAESASDTSGTISTSAGLRERGNAFYKKSQLIEGELDAANLEHFWRGQLLLHTRQPRLLLRKTLYHCLIFLLPTLKLANMLSVLRQLNKHPSLQEMIRRPFSKSWISDLDMRICSEKSTTELGDCFRKYPNLILTGAQLGSALSWCNREGTRTSLYQQLLLCPVL
jgi:hypothetical protein